MAGVEGGDEDVPLQGLASLLPEGLGHVQRGSREARTRLAASAFRACRSASGEGHVQRG